MNSVITDHPTDALEHVGADAIRALRMQGGIRSDGAENVFPATRLAEAGSVDVVVSLPRTTGGGA